MTTPLGGEPLTRAWADNLYAALGGVVSGGGGGTGGGGTGGGGTDTLAPAAPASVSLAVAVYADVFGASKDAITVTWPAVTTNSDGTAAYDIDHYEAAYSYSSGSSDTNTYVLPTTTTTHLSFQGLTPGPVLMVGVRTVDRSGNRSAYTYGSATLSGDTSAPQVPSTPVGSNYLGLAKATWNGLDVNGANMPTDFSHVEVHWSGTSGFTPSSATKTDTLNAAGVSFYPGTVTYGQTYYCKLIAVDNSGNRSGASAAGAATPSQVVAADVFANCIGTAQLANAAIKTAQIDALAVNDAQIGSVSVGKLTAGLLNAQVIVGNQIATATTGSRCTFDSTGIHLYASDGTLVADLNTNGTAAFLGAIKSGSTVSGASIMGGTISGTTITGSMIVANGGYGSVTLGGPGNFNRIVWQSNNTNFSPTLIGIDEGSPGYFQIRGSTQSGTPARIVMPLDAYQTIIYGALKVTTSTELQGSVTMDSGLNVTGAIIATGNNVRGQFFQSNFDDSSSNTRLAMNNGGGIGIGTNSNNQRLLFFVGGTSSPAAYMISSGTITTSKRSVKKKIVTQHHDAAMADEIRLVQYESKIVDDGTKHYGVIAEELAEHDALSRFVALDEHGKPDGVMYDKLALATALSVNARVAALEARLAELEA